MPVPAFCYPVGGHVLLFVQKIERHKRVVAVFAADIKHTGKVCTCNDTVHLCPEKMGDCVEYSIIGSLYIKFLIVSVSIVVNADPVIISYP